MSTYDPDHAPDPAAWLALDEGARADLVERAHEGRFPDALHPANASERLHASLHAVVETQVASGQPAVTARTLARLEGEGLRRHAAVHAVADVLVRHLHRAALGRDFDEAAWTRELDALTAGDALGHALRSGPYRGGDDPVAPNRAARRAAKKGRS